MKRRKRTALLLVVMMLLSSISTLADVQERIPIGGIDYVEVSHVEGEEGNIIPHAKVSFQKVDSNAHTEGTTEHSTQYYGIQLKDSFGTTVTGKVNKSDLLASDAKATIENIGTYLDDQSKFLSGHFYELRILPGHKHETGNNIFVDAPLNPNTEDPVRYFVTDLNTTAKEVNNEIQVSWEYIKGATYQLVYIDRDAVTKDEVDGIGLTDYSGVGSKKVTLKADEMDTYNDNGVQKVKYVLEDTLQGQKYSAYVLVTGISSSATTGFKFNGQWSDVGVNTTTPKIAQATKSVKLDVQNIGNKRIELSWNLRSWMNGKINRTIVWRKAEGESSYARIGTIYNSGTSSGDSGRFEHDEPTSKCYYYVEFIIVDADGKESSIKTDETPYVPYALREQPLKPRVPEPFSLSLPIEDIGLTKDKYLVKDDDVSADKMKDNTFHVKSTSPLQVQLVWDAPMKKDDKGNQVVEHSMLYDIWVSDDKAKISDDNLSGDTPVEPVIKDLVISEGDANAIIKTQTTDKVVGFKTLLTQYIKSNGEVKDLVANKTYYIKIIAKRDYSGIIEKSQPTEIVITVDKNGDIFAPPVLGRPPLRVQENGVKKTEATIEWLEKWYEIKAKDNTAYTDANEKFMATLWNSKVFTGGTPSIKFKAETGLVKHDLLTEDNLKQVKASVSGFNTQYESRETSLGSNVKYEVKTMLYDDAIKNLDLSTTTTPSAIDIEAWVVKNEANTTEGWTTIDKENKQSSDSLDWKQYTLKGLTPNTRYMVLIRAYRELDTGEKLIQTYPSYVIFTTDTDYEAPEANPAVPILNPDGVTDTSVAVWWKYNSDFDYEIVYSRSEDPDNANTVDFKISDVPGEANYFANGSKARVEIKGLLPETTYHVWIRAKQKKGSEISAWSNPVTQTTKPLDAPDTPRGLRAASYQSILDIGKDFRPVTSEYITVEWLRDSNDTEKEQGDTSDSTKAYSYVVEFSDNPQFSDAVVVTTGADATGSSQANYEILLKNMVKFNGLNANKPYYVRAKTVLTFTDPETSRKIVKESEFTKYVRIITKTSDGEYDSGDNDNIVIYPDPIIENYEDGVWTKEIADQAKAITNIQSKQAYFYEINLDLYKNKYDAQVRRLKMPKPVLDTLINESMAIRFITHTGVYEVPASTLQYISKQYTAKDMVQFDFTKQTDNTMSTIKRSYPESLIKAEQLTIVAKGNKRNTTVNKFDGYMKVKLKLDVVEQYKYTDYFTYTYNLGRAAWVKETPTVETLKESYLTYSTAYPGIFALYEKAKGSTSDSSYIMTNIANTYGVTGLGTSYSQNDYVRGGQYINLLMGIAQNKNNIDLSETPSQTVLTNARKAGIYSGSISQTLTQQQAIAGVVKLYELKNGFSVQPSKISVNGVSAAYRQEVQKAYAIGLITDIDPSAKVTYSQLCDWIALVVQ